MRHVDKLVERLNQLPTEEKVSRIKVLDFMRKGRLIYQGSINNLDEIVAVLDEMHSNRWDIMFVEHGDAQTNIQQDLGYGLKIKLDFKFIIHYPELVITNTPGNQHLLRDVFVELVKTSTTSGKISFNDFKARRLTVTPQEVHHGYSHSHMSGAYFKFRDSDPPQYVTDRERMQDTALDFRGFCKGSSEIINVLSLLVAEYTDDMFRMFLMQLELYLSWESLEGGPHKQMSSIQGVASPNSIEDRHKSEVYSKLREREQRYPNEEFPVNFQMSDGVVSIKDDETFEEFLRYLPNIGDYNSNCVCRRDEQDVYYLYTQIVTRDMISTDRFNINDCQKANFYFRGELVEFKLIEPESNWRSADAPYYIHKSIKEYVKEKLENNIKEKAFRGHILSKYHSPTHS